MKQTKRLALGSLAACWTLVALLAFACGAAAITDLNDAALSARDLPVDWSPAEFDATEGSALFDVLPDLLSSNTDARLLLHTFEDQAGTNGVATILIEAADASALPSPGESNDVLEPLARLLNQQDSLLAPQVLGGDPAAYFGASDLPLAGSLRSRLVRLLDDESRLYSDSAIFTVGSVLAVVTVWYPVEDGPVRALDDLAGEVAGRLQVYTPER